MGKEQDITSRFKREKKNPYQELMGNSSGEEAATTDPKEETPKQEVSKSRVDSVVDRYMNQTNGKGKTSSDLVGIYFDSDVKRALAKKKKEFGRGFQSEFVNNLVREELERREWL